MCVTSRLKTIILTSFEKCGKIVRGGGRNIPKRVADALFTIHGNANQLCAWYTLCVESKYYIEHAAISAEIRQTCALKGGQEPLKVGAKRYVFSIYRVSQRPDFRHLLFYQEISQSRDIAFERYRNREISQFRFFRYISKTRSVRKRAAAASQSRVRISLRVSFSRDYQKVYFTRRELSKVAV